MEKEITDKNPEFVSIVLMRHAESTFNVELNTIFDKYQNKKTIDHKEFVKLHKNLTSSKNSKIINARLSENGVKQCKKAYKILDQLPNIKRIILSPYRRVIQTFEETFESHPKITNNQ